MKWLSSKNASRSRFEDVHQVSRWPKRRQADIAANLTLAA
jgi:hypothetical protein